MKLIKKIGNKFADVITSFIGSWTFIILQTVIVLFWIIMNLIVWINHFDPYPFILLNLFFSLEAAYATPLILMASSKQSAKDSENLEKDLRINNNTNKLIKKINEDILEIKEELKKK